MGHQPVIEQDISVESCGRDPVFEFLRVDAYTLLQAKFKYIFRTFAVLFWYSNVDQGIVNNVYLSLWD